MFDQLQMRQAEVESVQSHLESLQNQNTELQYQLREAQDRIALLTYDVQEAQREQESRSQQVTTSPEEVARLLSFTELKYEAKLTEMKTQLQQLETERNDSESEWSRKVRDKAKEVDDLKNLLEANSRSRGEHEKLVDRLRAEKAQLQDEARLSQQQLAELLSTKELVESIEVFIYPMFTYCRLDVVFRRKPLKNEKQNLQAQYKISNDK
jgi:chromosome segregation ATPase